MVSLSRIGSGRGTYLWKEEVDKRHAEEQHDAEQEIDPPPRVRNGCRGHLRDYLGHY